MVYIMETEISNTRNVRKSLEEIYGLGKKRSNLICNKLGIAPSFKTSQLSQSQVNGIMKSLESSEFILTSDLRKSQIIASKNLIRIKSIKGLRRLRGLPVRGQRTHTNAKNCRSRKNL